MKIYRFSKIIQLAYILFLIWLVWNAWRDYSEERYVYALISICASILCILYLFHIFSLKVMIANGCISISTIFKSYDEIPWQRIETVKLSKYVIWGKPDIYIKGSGIKKKISIPGNMINFSELLGTIVSKASNSEIDDRVSKYLNGKNVKKQIDKRIIITGLALFILGVFFVYSRSIRGTTLLPKNLRYLYLVHRIKKHHIKTPEDLFSSIVNEEFNFSQQGFSKTFKLMPKYNDLYVLGISSDKPIISSDYRFKGKLKLEFLCNNILLHTIIIDKMQSASYYGNDSTYYKNVCLHMFEIPIDGENKKDVVLKITVLEPELNLIGLNDFVKLYIGVYPIPDQGILQ